MSFEDLLEEHERRIQAALAMGGPVKLAARKAEGILNARERLRYLLDADSFVECGLLAVSTVVPEDRDRTPADGKVTGFGTIASRRVGVAANDFTVKGASSSLSNMKKLLHVKRVASECGFPLIFLGESSGARMPDNMGASGMGRLLGNDPTQYIRERTSPWVSAILGPCYGSSAWYAALSDFVVFRKGAVMAVASPQLVSMAVGQRVEPEDLGGWQLHSEVTGFADAVVESDEEGIDLIKKFLDYLPSNRNQAPPQRAVPSGSDEAARAVLDYLPESRNRGYEVRRIVGAIVDKDSIFELKPKFGTTAVTALARLGGRTVGIVANNPLRKGGALDVSACEKITSFLVLCDSFNIPLVFFVDTPGFLIGIEGERQRAPGKIMNFMMAMQMCSVPKLSVIVRKSYGQAYLNMGGGRNSDEVVAWPTAEVSFMDPVYGAKVVTWGREETEPGIFEKSVEKMRKDTSPYELAANFAVQSIIRPKETRRFLIEMLDVHRSQFSDGKGSHRLASWPTTL